MVSEACTVPVELYIKINIQLFGNTEKIRLTGLSNMFFSRVDLPK